MSEANESLLAAFIPPAVSGRFSRIEAKLQRANDDPEIRAAYQSHVESCPSCVAGPICRKAWEILLPPDDVRFLFSDPLRDTPDTVELYLRRKSTKELELIVAEDPENRGRWVQTAARLLVERRGNNGRC